MPRGSGERFVVGILLLNSWQVIQRMGGASGGRLVYNRGDSSFPEFLPRLRIFPCGPFGYRLRLRRAYVRLFFLCCRTLTAASQSHSRAVTITGSGVKSAGVAQLAEHWLPKPIVAGSNPVTRSLIRLAIAREN